MRLSIPNVCGGGSCSIQQTVQRKVYEDLEGGVEIWSVGDFVAGELKGTIVLAFEVGTEVDVDNGCRDPEPANVCSGNAMKEEIPATKGINICYTGEQKWDVNNKKGR